MDVNTESNTNDRQKVMELTGIILRLIIVLVLLVTLAILTAVLTIVWSMPDLPKVYPSDLCLKLAGEDHLTCEHASLSKFAQERMGIHYESLVNDYDANNKDIGKGIIEQKSYIHKHKVDITPVVRLTGDFVDGDDKQTKYKTGVKQAKLVPVRKWTSLRDLVSTGGIRQFGVQIKKGRIIVPVGGEYEIFSYIHFREHCIDGIPQIEDVNIPVQQSIFKFDILDGRDVEVASCTQPHKISQSYYTNMYGSFLSSVVTLRAGDELSVKVTNITHLFDPTSNYFGAFLI